MRCRAATSLLHRAIISKHDPRGQPFRRLLPFAAFADRGSSAMRTHPASQFREHGSLCVARASQSGSVGAQQYAGRGCDCERIKFVAVELMMGSAVSRSRVERRRCPGYRRGVAGAGVGFAGSVRNRGDENEAQCCCRRDTMTEDRSAHLLEASKPQRSRV